MVTIAEDDGAVFALPREATKWEEWVISAIPEAGEDVYT